MTEHPREVLRRLEQRARRRFGQHFLVEPSVSERMVRGARVASGDRVVEIGPGLGILTRALERVGAEVTAVELDRDLAAWLREEHPGVRIVQADALKMHWAELCPGGGWKVVANLPYNVGTHVLMTLLRLPAVFVSVTVMLQLEVVQRLMAQPGTKAYGALTVEARARAQPLFLFELGPGAFHPPPKVRSAVVRFDLHAEPRTRGVEPAAFDRVVRAAFSQRRKTVLNSLSALYGRERAAAALRDAELDPRQRAEQLSVEAFRRLAVGLEGPPAERGPSQLV